MPQVPGQAEIRVVYALRVERLYPVAHVDCLLKDVLAFTLATCCTFVLFVQELFDNLHYENDSVADLPVQDVEGLHLLLTVLLVCLRLSEMSNFLLVCLEPDQLQNVLHFEVIRDVKWRLLFLFYDMANLR